MEEQVVNDIYLPPLSSSSISSAESSPFTTEIGTITTATPDPEIITKLLAVLT
ncbi:hypothetical protein [Glaciimonas sp. PCH181]|uniref:hypothetical protein n=1 Tax=Glaciimonas sp. PCH181 TaxID=2133943 RepID=UPI0013751D88|nr:hypothetical protein [Glaciimonas sp. PCH181]